MAWDKGDITTDITSQVHARGGPKANKLQAGTNNLQEGVAMEAKVQKTATASQTLKQNQEEDYQKKATAPAAQSHDGQDQSKIVAETDRVQITADIKAQNATSRQSDSRVNKDDSTVKQKHQAQLELPNEVQKPKEHQKEMMKILSGSPASAMGKAENTTEGATSGLGGYDEDVVTTSEIDQDHPRNAMGAKARAEGVEKDRPTETKPGQLESGVGTTIDKML